MVKVALGSSALFDLKFPPQILSKYEYFRFDWNISRSIDPIFNPEF